MWLFDGAEFREWLADRGSDGASDELPPSLQDRCLSCGTELGLVPYSHGMTCGFCLAHEFGRDCQEDEAAAAVIGIVQILNSGDRNLFKYVFRHLRDEVRAVKNLVGASDEEA